MRNGIKLAAGYVLAAVVVSFALAVGLKLAEWAVVLAFEVLWRVFA